MTRTEYIAKLTKYLRKLPQKDYEEALEYFMEYFEEAGPENEAQVIVELVRRLDWLKQLESQSRG